MDVKKMQTDILWSWLCAVYRISKLMDLSLYAVLLCLSPILYVCPFHLHRTVTLVSTFSPLA